MREQRDRLEQRMESCFNKMNIKIPPKVVTLLQARETLARKFPRIDKFDAASFFEDVSVAHVLQSIDFAHDDLVDYFQTNANSHGIQDRHVSGRKRDFFSRRPTVLSYVGIAIND